MKKYSNKNTNKNTNKYKMEIEYPKYPFLWNYDDMFNLIEYDIIKIDKEYNEETTKLGEIFPDKSIVIVNQKIKKENIDKMILNIQTTYLDKLDIFESNESTIKIITNHKINYKKDVPIFVYDAYDNLERQEFNPKKLCIVKNFNTIVNNINKIPLLYMRIHTIKGIIRFSPSDNSKILFKNDIDTENIKFFTITENTIILNNITVM